MQRLRIVLVSLSLTTTACQKSAEPAVVVPAAKADPVSSEIDLLSITLTRDAEQRLGVATVAVEARNASVTRLTSGEIVNAPLGPTGVPSVTTSDFAGLASRQAAANAEVHRAQASMNLAEQMVQRASALVNEEAGSVRARDEAIAQRAAAEAALAAARTQRELLGPDLAPVNGNATLWVRVPVIATDISRLVADQPARIGVPGADAPTHPALPVRTLPTANPAVGTTDVFYRVGSGDLTFRVGQRVAVYLPMRGQLQGRSIPASALVMDIHGGEWVYRHDAAGYYLRQRVEVAQRVGDELILSRGLAEGDSVVAAGAAELFGYEFGTGR